jgi:hypothetical protein
MCAEVRGQGETTIALDGVTIVTDGDNASYVQYAVDSLDGYIKELTGVAPPIATSLARNKGLVIGIGVKTAEEIFGEKLPADKVGENGYLLKSISKDGGQFLVAVGITPQGTKSAVYALMKMIRPSDHSAVVPAVLDILSKPTFTKRGMHFNGWSFNYPYSFRRWSEQDWKNYIDILSYQNVNLLYLWPFMEIMPVPLSKEDQAYLEECRRVVEYAQKCHGMEVWIMQCTNRVANDRLGVEDPRLRPYWRPAQKDLNPGDPQDFKAIMNSREALYRIVNNVDGVCNIDSDPGEWPGSPLSDYLKVLNGCRALLDQINIHHKDTKLIDWMWTGWGVQPKQIFNRHNQVLTIQMLKRDLPEPWELVAGQNSFLTICRDEHVLEKTILLQYGLIEGEPAYPITDPRMNGMRDAFNKYLLKYPKIAGVMGNLETPLLQFPEMYFFTTNIWDPSYRVHTNEEVLADVSELLYPDHAKLIAECFLALQQKDAANAQASADQLEPLVHGDKLGRLGVFGRKLFPDHLIVARSLLLQLRYRAAQEKFAQIPADLTESEYVKRIANYLEAYLAWDTAHGWHALWGWDQWPLGSDPLDKALRAAAGRVGKSLGTSAAINDCFDQVSHALTAKYEASAIQIGCIAPLKTAAIAAVQPAEQKASGK